MVEKLITLFGSVRFWIIVLSAVLAILNGQPFVETVQIALAAVATLGTIDGVASRLAGTKK